MSGAAAGGRVRGEYAAAMLALVAGAGLLLFSAGRVWATGELAAPGPVTATRVEITGADLTGTLSGIGWAGLAAVAGLYASRGTLRRLVGLLVAAGAALALAAVWNATRPEALLAAVNAAGAAGNASAAQAPALSAAGPVMSAAGAALLLLAGVAVILRSPSWPGMGSRYDRVAAPRANRAGTPADLWKSLDAGDDPTLDAPGAGVPARPASGDGIPPAQPTGRSAEPKEKP